MKIRTFICIELPDSIKTKLGEIQTEMKTLGSNVRWTRTDGIHLTLKFLGNVEKQNINQIVEQIAEASRVHSPVEIEVKESGAFPDFKKPRVFWIGVHDPSGALARLQMTIDTKLEKIGFEKENRRFSPHLTIGRVKSHDGLNATSRALEEMSIEPMAFLANQVVVMQSHLQLKGAVYTPLHIIKL
jgi:RNA 2',3'-cyclic 3'-phosphodiesterase